MAEVSISFTVTGNKKILKEVQEILTQIDEDEFVGMDVRLKKDGLHVYADAVDVEMLKDWTVQFQEELCEEHSDSFSFSINGVLDNDYCTYIAFEFVCNEESIKCREYDEMDDDERMDIYEEEEKEALKELSKLPWEVLETD